MGRFELTETVVAPAAEVFSLVADIAGAAERIRGIDRVELLCDGPVGVGTRWRETRTMGGGTATEEMTITAFDPPRSYAAECVSCGCHYRSTLSVAADGDRSRVTMTVTTRPLTTLAWLMAPLAAVMSGTAKRALAADLADLRNAAERAAAS